MLIRQLAVSFWGFSASFATALYLGEGTGYAACVATVVSTLLTCIWTLAYLAASFRHRGPTPSEYTMLHSIMQNRCPDCDKLALELTSDNIVECLDCGSRFGVNIRNGFPKRITS